MFDRLKRGIVYFSRYLLLTFRPSGAMANMDSLFLYTYRPSGAFLCRNFYAKR